LFFFVCVSKKGKNQNLKIWGQAIKITDVL
jgi:hypothetical protein